MIARIWLALVVLLLAAAHASAMPIDMPGDHEVADVITDDVPVVLPVEAPVAETRGTSRISYVAAEEMPSSASGENLFRPPRPSID